MVTQQLSKQHVLSQEWQVGVLRKQHVCVGENNCTQDACHVWLKGAQAFMLYGTAYFVPLMTGFAMGLECIILHWGLCLSKLLCTFLHTYTALLCPYHSLIHLIGSA